MGLFAFFGLLLVGGLTLSLFDDDDSDSAETEGSTSLEDEFNGQIETGSSGDDILAGGPRDDFLSGDAGNDILRGFLGNDLLVGGADDDTLFGADGDDTLDGGQGDDVLQGQDGRDLLLGDSGDDLLLGGNDADLLFGENGQDTLRGGTGNDILIGIESNAGVADDSVENAGDTLDGGFGNDLILVGSQDVATGGAGADTFTFGTYIEAGRSATITDFDPDEDVLEVQYVPDLQAVPVISLMEEDEDTLVALDGVEVMRIEGITGIDPATIRLTAI
ncbi:calcium-binding protein [Jannaschia donghaensis]|uniref:Hemolysin, chromosomal n=1 Tax=Jannaschia donghaensis TaxID=420998 RepID=A0A0M6YJ78_9RHOB|nr:calcium-binding protein [Jannaschia donghaensis]CTQ49974.1 Hemolysin, chromosomal [Jannaschia donghaensis]